MSPLAPVGAPSAAPSPSPPPQAPAELEAAARQFEAIFLRQMLGAARSAKLADDILGSSEGDQFREMRDADVADRMAAGGGIGIATAVIAQLSRQAGSAER